MRVKGHRIWRAIRQNRKLLTAVAIVFATIGGLGSYSSYRYSAVVVLAQIDEGNRSQSLKELAPLLQEHLRKLEVLQATADGCGLSMKAENLRSAATVETGNAAGTVEVRVRLSKPAEAVALANALAIRAMNSASELAALPGRTVLPVYADKLAEAERQLKTCSERLIELQQEAQSGHREDDLEEYGKHRQELELKLAENESLAGVLALQVKSLEKEVAAHHPAVLTAQQALDRALLRYTDDHPKVQELRMTLAAVQARVHDPKDEVDPEIALNGNSMAQNLYSKLMSVRDEEKLLDAKKRELSVALNALNEKLKSFPDAQVRYARARSDYQLWNKNYQKLLGEMARQQLMASTTKMPFELQKVSSSPLQPGKQRFDFAAIMALVVSSLATTMLAVGLAWHACLDPWVRSERDLFSAASVPVLERLPDLSTMTSEEQEKWAFLAFTQLKTKLVPTTGDALVCGFTSSCRGEGRSTWIRLLAGTARKQGYEVVVVAAAPKDPAPEVNSQQTECAADGQTLGLTLFTKSQPMQLTLESVSEAQVFVVPAQAAWSLENRLQWQQGIQQLAKVPNSVVLVEFPPASEPETFLLTQNFPNLIWVCGQGMARDPEIRTQVKTLNASRANLVGAVLNFSQA